MTDDRLLSIVVGQFCIIILIIALVSKIGEVVCGIVGRRVVGRIVGVVVESSVVIDYDDFINCMTWPESTGQAHQTNQNQDFVTSVDKHAGIDQSICVIGTVIALCVGHCITRTPILSATDLPPTGCGVAIKLTELATISSI